jgi:hypothetical protein
MSKTMVPVRMSEELVARMDARTENRSALIVAAVEAYLGESPKQMIIEKAKEPSPRVTKPKESASPIVREKPKPIEEKKTGCPDHGEGCGWARMGGWWCMKASRFMATP